MEETIGKRIMHLRKSRGLTQEQLAEQLGVTAQAVSKWENDVSCPDVTLLPKLAEVFQVTTDFLLGRPMAAEVVEPPHKKPKDKTGEYSFQWDVSSSTLPWFATAVLLFAVAMLLNRTVLAGYGEARIWSLMWPAALLSWGICSLWSKISLLSIGLTLCGGYWLVNNMNLIQQNFELPWSIILLGLLILWAISSLIRHFRGNRRKWKCGHFGGAKAGVRSPGRLQHEISFSSDRIFVDEFQCSGGYVSVSFGDLIIDLRGCSTVLPDAYLQADVSFGSLTLLLPHNWKVQANPSRSFGSVSTHGVPSPTADQVLQVMGNVSFGSLDLRWE